MYAAGRLDLTRPTALLRWHGRKLRGSPRRWQPPTAGSEYVVNVTNSGELARASKVVSAYDCELREYGGWAAETAFCDGAQDRASPVMGLASFGLKIGIFYDFL
jgi:hypothetical protein